MRIVELRAENVKRLKAVEITPDGTMQVIGGRNAQGKSSVLDAIWLALGGGKASKDTPLPIRDGEETAEVRLDLGDLIITRRWTKSGTTLKVENGDGATFKSPQGMLDALVGQLSFDPLAFTRLSAREQRQALLDLVDINLDALDQQAADLYRQRTDVGRQIKSVGDVPTIDNTLPDTETSASEILSEIREIQDANEHRAAWEREQVARRLDCEKTAAEILRLTELLKEQTAAFEQAQAKKSQYPEFRPIEPLQDQLSQVEGENARIRENRSAKDQKAWKDMLSGKYEGLTQRLTELDEQKAAALAGAQFPVEGLSFDAGGVTYRGVPLSQASSAEQIRVSLAMGMALNPRLRVLMIKDGSLLDSDSMAAIRDQVTEGGFQLWLERVGDADQGAVIIEDGQVA